MFNHKRKQFFDIYKLDLIAVQKYRTFSNKFELFSFINLMQLSIKSQVFLEKLFAYYFIIINNYIYIYITELIKLIDKLEIIMFIYINVYKTKH